MAGKDMRRSVVVVLVAALVAAWGLAAVTQTGYVKTRGRLGANGKVVPGDRLSGATVVLQGGSSVVSNGSGGFTLSVPSGKFFVKDVKKTGYSVADPDFLSRQYSCNPNPLILVLEQPTTQLDARLESQRKLTRDLEKQLHAREAELDALKKENKITQDQYRDDLQKLYSDYESNRKFVEEMAERYSKIDFDQIDEFQTQVASFIQNGELARADSLLRTKGSMVEREAEIRRLQVANAEEEKELAERRNRLSESKKTADALMTDYADDCYNRFEICKLKSDNDSAAYWLEKRAEVFPENIEYCFDAGNFIHIYLSRYSLAFEYFSKALNLTKARYGENHKDAARCYNNIAVIYRNNGDYAQAMENHLKALKIRREIFGDCHPDVALSYNNIGVVYDDESDYEKALENHERALDIRLKIFGENHPDVAMSYNNIGLAYSNQGLYAQAWDNYKKSLDIRLDFFGENHPDVATCYDNIGSVYYRQGEYEKALENHQKALGIQLGIFGERHRDVATSYYNIGLVYDSQGNYAQALENYEKALMIRLALLGETHPKVEIVRDNLANVKSKMGNMAECEIVNGKRI